MPNQSGKVVLVLILLILIAGAAVYFFLLPGFKKGNIVEQIPIYSPKTIESNVATNSAQQLREYYSKALKITIKVPDNAKIEEKFNSVIFDFSNGKIVIDFNGTNFDNAKGYYSELRQKNHLNPITYQEGKLGKYDYVLTMEKSSGDPQKVEKIYFIYTDNRVFPVSTSDEVLYPVLDQIVQSFEYRP